MQVPVYRGDCVLGLIVGCRNGANYWKPEQPAPSRLSQSNQQSLTFLAPGARFMEDNFSRDLGRRELAVSGREAGDPWSNLLMLLTGKLRFPKLSQQDLKPSLCCFHVAPSFSAGAVSPGAGGRQTSHLLRPYCASNICLIPFCLPHTEPNRRLGTLCEHLWD